MMKIEFASTSCIDQDGETNELWNDKLINHEIMNMHLTRSCARQSISRSIENSLHIKTEHSAGTFLPFMQPKFSFSTTQSLLTDHRTKQRLKRTINTVFGQCKVRLSFMEVQLCPIID